MPTPRLKQNESSEACGPVVLKNRGIIELANAQAEGRKVVRMISRPIPVKQCDEFLRVLAGELQLRSDVGSR